MAITRKNIRDKIIAYLPQINTTSKLTLINDAINLALEDLCCRPGQDFRFLRSKTPDSATMNAGDYYLELTSFGIIGNTSSYFRDITAMFLLYGANGNYPEVKFMDDDEFHHTFGYIDYTSRTRGYPSHYTRLEDRLIFNCPAQETLTVRVWWNKYHAPLADDTTGVLLFPLKDQSTALQAVVYLALAELKNSLNTVEFPQELTGCEKRAEGYIGKLLARDKDINNEDHTVVASWGERSHLNHGSPTNPYGWVK